MTARAFALVTALAVLTAIAGCATITPYEAAIVTATKLDQKFIEVGQLYDMLYQAGKMPEQDYRQWAVFAEQYKLMSDIVHKSLKAAKSDADIEAAVATMNRLAMDLAVYMTYGVSRKE